MNRVSNSFGIWPTGPTAESEDASVYSPRRSVYIHIRMVAREPDFFDVRVRVAGTRIAAGTRVTAGSRIHFQKVLRQELYSTFVKGKCMSEVARVRCRCGGGDVDIAPNKAQGRHCIPSSKSGQRPTKERQRDATHQTPMKWILTPGKQKSFLKCIAKSLVLG